jgi:hypothetical protein
MKRKILAPAIVTAILAAGLSIGSLRAQQGGAPQVRRDAVSNSRHESTATSIAVAGSHGANSLLQTAVVDGPSLGNSPFALVSPAIPGLTQIAKLQAEATWGMATMPLPSYLRHADLGLEPNQGLLVTQLIPGLPVANSGIEVGSLILELDGRPVLDIQQLPILQAEHKLTVMCKSGLKEVCVKPFAENLLGANPAMDQFLGHGTAFDQLLPQIGVGFRGLPTTALSQPAPRSLSVSQVNDEISVSAIVDGAHGPTRIELRGCRAEIAKQLSQLPVAVQTQLAPHLGL